MVCDVQHFIYILRRLLACRLEACELIVGVHQPERRRAGTLLYSVVLCGRQAVMGHMRKIGEAAEQVRSVIARRWV